MTSVPADDRGLLLGDGLFETVLFKAGRPALWDRHLARLARGCAALGLAEPAAEDLAVAAERALDQAGLSQARAAVRLTWTAGSGGRGLDRPDPISPRLIVMAAPAPRADGPARLVLSAIRRNETSPASRLKTLAYLDNVLARRQARAQGVDEALMLNSAGQVAGCAAANLFWICGDRLFTPALECGVLDGVMRGEVLAVAADAGLEAVQTCEGLAALLGAQAAFMTNSLIGLRPVESLDGCALGADARVLRLSEACAEVS